MAAPTSCTVSGTLLEINGTAMSGITVKARPTRPFIHPTDNNLYMDYEVSTTTDGSGNWSLTLIETATPAVSYTVEFLYALGSTANNTRYSYTIVVPNSATANFQTLIAGQV